MRVAPLAFLAAVLVPFSPSPAQEDARLTSSRPVKSVVELFTSQGCSSCPPADALLKRYAERTDIVALSLPVDYWDYLGWKDTLASPRNTQRQRAYARARGDGEVYTPQVVVNGVAHTVGSNASRIDHALAESGAAFQARQVPVRVWHEGSALVVQAGEAPAGSDATEAIVWLAVVQKTVEVPVKRGENGGRTLTFYNVARELTPVGTWNGKSMAIRLARTALMRPETETCAVLLQKGEGGPIIGAAWMGL